MPPSPPPPAIPSSAAGIGIPPLPRTGPASWLPGLWVLRHYQARWFPRDLIAGIVLTTLLVPAGMGYAEAAGLPAISGLHATIIPLLAYAVFGPSRIMVLGPDSGLAAMIAAVVIGMGNGTPDHALALASMLAILTGGFCVVAGFAKAGFLTELLSRPVRVGYMNGIALTVIVTQLPKLFGFTVHATDVGQAAWAFGRGVLAGQTRPTALLIGGACLVVILVTRRVAPRVPGVLLAVVGATIAVAALDLASAISVVGAVPSGLPRPALPQVTLTEARDLIVAAIGIALVSFADTSVLSRTVAGRHGYRVDANRELIGLGVANVAAGFFRGFPVSSSASRTPVAESAGSRTQLTGVIGALAIVVLLVAAPWLLADLPTTALAAVVISAAIRNVELRELIMFRRVRRSDFVLSMIALLAVAGLGVLTGIVVAVVVSLLDFIRRAWRPYDAILGRADGVKGYHDISRYADAKQVPGLLIFRWDAPLFFANADTFRERVIDAVDELAATSPVRWVVIAAEPITDVDTTAAEMLQELDAELAARHAELAFAEMKDPVKDRLERYGLQAKIGREFFFPTVGVAVKAFLERTGVTWVDWEDGAEPE
jgi:high affinity sulfate transporter 1